MWVLIINAASEQVEFIADFLEERGALSVSLRDSGDQPLFQEILNETPLWENTQIQAIFDEEILLNPMILELQSLLKKSFTYRVEKIEEENWVEKTQRNFPPQYYGDCLRILPAWLDAADYPGGAVLRLNPGMGFGTGSHATTSLCLKWLSAQEVSGKTVMDYGCGSGILGLSALALGAKEVWAVDHDPQALTATKNNADLNHFSDSNLTIVSPENLPDNISADIILANILANPLCELAPRLIGLLAKEGKLALSGFLLSEKERVLNAYDAHLKLIFTDAQQSEDSHENWIFAVLKKDELHL